MNSEATGGSVREADASRVEKTPSDRDQQVQPRALVQQSAYRIEPILGLRARYPPGSSPVIDDYLQRRSPSCLITPNYASRHDWLGDSADARCLTKRPTVHSIRATQSTDDAAMRQSPPSTGLNSRPSPLKGRLGNRAGQGTVTAHLAPLDCGAPSLLFSIGTYFD
ncbi:hypothetical protein Poly51_15720 [Rubripirellula tenax]|uniref:Uncharacterized protein n=1 Tax=Rubripirellula tenax TaxID=2528015 RepID=A0A5C6FDH4_9BACT|nr:hypothetical protein Poly51_15720 [Rubripirellula tenax]